MPEDLIQRHDQFAKAILDLPGHADAFLRERLPPAVVAQLGPEPALDRSESFIDPLLGEHRCDRVYALQSRSGHQILVWALLEHKSAPEPNSLVQTLTQLAGIATKGATRRRNSNGTVWLVPAPVYAIILHQSSRRWPLPTELSQAYALPPGLTPHGLLTFIYTLVNLAEIADDALSNLPSLRAALLVLKHAQQDRDPLPTLERLLSAAAALDLTTLALVIRYLHRHSDWISLERLRPVLARLIPGQEEAVITPIMQEIIDEARPRIVDEERPRIIDEERPRIIDEERPRIIDEARPSIVADALLRLLRRRFGALPAEIEMTVRAADLEQLDDWTDRFVDASCLDDLFDRPLPQ